MSKGQIIGLTGPIASGKNEVAKILKKFGAEVIDVDQEAHDLYPFGAAKRKKLAEVVFHDKKKLQELNRIVHPKLRQKVIERSRLLVVSCKLLVINAAVLKEIGLISLCDEVWTVMAKRETRLKRLLKKGLVRQSAIARLRSQMSQKEYLKLA
ncbi:MAG: dephospho-CoA kinase, partial [bacterium]